MDVNRCAETQQGAIVVHVELDFGWQVMAKDAMVSKYRIAGNFRGRKLSRNVKTGRIIGVWHA